MTDDKFVISGNPFEEDKFDIDQNLEYFVMVHDTGVEIVSTNEITYSKYQFWRDASREHEHYELRQMTGMAIAQSIIDGAGFDKEVVNTDSGETKQ